MTNESKEGIKLNSHRIATRKLALKINTKAQATASLDRIYNKKTYTS